MRETDADRLAASRRREAGLRAARYRDLQDYRAHPLPQDEAAARRRGPGGAAPPPAMEDDDGRVEAGGHGRPDGEPPRLREDDNVYDVAEEQIQRAMARGDFDHLAYAGKPLPDLVASTDPDWWLKGLIHRENLTGLGPEALLLRSVDANLDERLDSLPTEASVRQELAAFNARVVEARRQLLGGPPVVTKTRDVDEEVRRWRERRRASDVVPVPEPDGGDRGRAPGRRWWRRLGAWLWEPSR